MSRVLERSTSQHLRQDTMLKKLTPTFWLILLGVAAPTLILGLVVLDRNAFADGPSDFYLNHLNATSTSTLPVRLENVEPDDKAFYSRYDNGDEWLAQEQETESLDLTTTSFLSATPAYPAYSPNTRGSAVLARLDDITLHSMGNAPESQPLVLPHDATPQIQRDLQLPLAHGFAQGQEASEPTIVALSDLVDEAKREEEQFSPSDSDTLPSPTDSDKTSSALFDDDDFDDDADDEDKDDDDEEEDDDEQDNQTPITYPFDLQQLPPHVSLSIGEARRGALENNKDIRVIAFEPSEAAEDVGIETAEFDPTLTVDVDGGKLDEQVSSQLQAQGINIDALQTDFFNPQDDELGGLILQKRLRTGGTVQWGYNADYNFFSPAGNFVTVNPAWLSRTTMRIEQPLFKGRGAQIALAPIETAEAEQQISDGEFKTLVQETLRDLEIAYWEAALAANSYRLLQDAARRAFETLSREEELIEAGRGSLPDSLQAEEQYRTIRSELADAKAAWGTASREIYRLLGVPHSQQQALVWTTETPTAESLMVDPSQAEQAVRNHPEYVGQLAAIRAAEIEVRTAANALQPDLAVRFAYAFSGLADGLDDAIDIMVDRRFNNWTAGVVFRHPFGRRAELANVRKSHLALSREYATLEQIEHDLLYTFHEGYELAKSKIELYQEQAERRQKAEALLEAQQELYKAGRIDIDLQLRSERALIDARISEIQALSEAWTATSEFRYALGRLN